MGNTLPKNWVQTELSTIMSYVIGGDWGKDPDSIDDNDFIEVLCIRGSEIKYWNENKGKTASLRKIKKSSLASRKLQYGDILLEISGGGPDQPVGRTVFIDKDVLRFEPGIEKVCTNFLRLVRIYDNLNSSYVNNFLQYFYNSGDIVNYQGGSNNLRNLKFKEYETISIPLPPLAEQNRIVEKLDTLFAQLETIKTSMAKVPELLKSFRQKVLTQAVIGKLTQEWRKGKDFEEWNSSTVGKFMLEVKDKIDPIDMDDTAYIGLEHIQKDGGIIEIGNSVDVKSNKTVFKKGDVLYGKLRPYLNKHDVVNFDGICSTDILVYRNTNLNSSKFFNYFLGVSKTIEILNGEAKGINLPRVSATIVNNLEIKIPSNEEQQEIVSRVESLFAKADAIEKQYETFKAKIDSLPQAILHKAFKGELTEQLDSDGDARELLREIEMLRKAQHDKGVKSKTTKSVTKKVKSYIDKDEVLDMVVDTKEKFQPKVVKLKPTNTEIYKRTLLAAEIVYQLKETNTLGHLKLQKMLYLCQEIGSMNLPMNFLKQAMGPYDNLLARSLDKQFVVKKWFEYKRDELLKYQPLENCGSHKEDFNKYFETEIEQVNYLINKFNKFTSNQIEAVATLYACWKEAINNKEIISDKLIITKFYQWSKEKEKFREENLIKALDWMRRNGVYPNS